ncbi:hypothetical protein ACFXG4_17895 [Nocardia sp. NPDC059246]|uniref:hypothetical protein n=1 Tax=unclassified Nocardia TaxID=2637762 RepID=UPI0036A78019
MFKADGRGRDTLGPAIRGRALAVADPVLDLERCKSLLTSRDRTGYQMEELALNAIDTITLKRDFEDGTKHEDVVVAVVGVARSQMPGHSTEEHDEVAGWILDSLVYVSTVDRRFSHVHGVTSGGTFASHIFSDRLLREVVGLDGRPRLRASNDAIAVPVGAVDIASEQVAADAELSALVKRGRLIDAIRTPETALRVIAQNAEHIRTRLDGIRRDNCSVRWVRDVLRIRSYALAYIEECVEIEKIIKGNVIGLMDKSFEEATPAQAADLITILIVPKFDEGADLRVFAQHQYYALVSVFRRVDHESVRRPGLQGEAVVPAARKSAKQQPVGGRCCNEPGSCSGLGGLEWPN